MKKVEDQDSVAQKVDRVLANRECLVKEETREMVSEPPTWRQAHAKGWQRSLQVVSPGVDAVEWRRSRL